MTQSTKSASDLRTGAAVEMKTASKARKNVYFAVQVGEFVATSVNRIKMDFSKIVLYQ